MRRSTSKPGSPGRKRRRAWIWAVAIALALLLGLVAVQLYVAAVVID